jgi:nitroreductase
MDIETVDHLLTTTRSVRKRLDLDRPVEPEVILECLRLAVQAPTGSNMQGWRFLVVTDPERKARLGELYRAGGEEYLKAGREQASGNDQQERVIDSAWHLLEVIDRVPAMLIPCHRGRPPEGIAAAGYYGSILPAVWSFMLALRSRGLGSAWTTFHLAYEREAAELLEIPYEEVTQTALLPVAYTLGTDFKPATRRPVEEITYLDRWREPLAPAGE